MWPFKSRNYSIPGGLSLTPEDLQVLSQAIDDRPEYVRFWMGLRDQRRKALDFSPILKTEQEIFAHGLRCHDIQRDLKLLTAIIEMPLTAAKALDRVKKSEPENKSKTVTEPWDEPTVPEEDF